MKQHTANFKAQEKEMGKELKSIITFSTPR